MKYAGSERDIECRWNCFVVLVSSVVSGEGEGICGGGVWGLGGGRLTGGGVAYAGGTAGASRERSRGVYGGVLGDARETRDCGGCGGGWRS